jgi:hypothetical protein
MPDFERGGAILGLKICAIVIIITGALECVFCQAGRAGYPFDTPVDPRGVAMGESFVALPSDHAALMYNPAGLAGLSGLSVSYSRKSLDWFLQDWSFYSINATVGTSFGVFAAQYNRESILKYSPSVRVRHSGRSMAWRGTETGRRSGMVRGFISRYKESA